MLDSSTSADPWSDRSTGSRHALATSPLDGGGAAVSVQDTESSAPGPISGGQQTGPLVATVERSGWTQEDVELALRILQIVALLVAAYAAWGTE